MKHIRNKSNRMARHMRMLPVLLIAVVALILGSAAAELSAWDWPGLGKFEDAEFFIEFNDTDKDVGVQAFFDGEAWKWVKIVGRDGRIFEVEAKGSLKEIGLTELRFESDEPQVFSVPDGDEPPDMTLEEFLELFPEGKYRFYGRTVEGDLLWGKAFLSHDIPCAPDISVVVDDTVTISWDPVINKLDNATGECGGDPITIVGYQVIVEFVEDVTERVFEFLVDLPASATEVTVPSEFIDSLEALGGEFKAEVLAIEERGNRTITEEEFGL